ncbi:hypothetical protein Lal_00030196 [Lupinus albus]|nr:hypothetical protein Lal_00030196 [Lupinus albus]
MVEQRFKFPHEIEEQGVVTFLELKGRICRSLVQQFNVNFHYKDGRCRSLVLERLILMNDELFLVVGGSTSDGAPLGNCDGEKWSGYDSTDMYKSCLKGPHYYVPREFTKVGSLLVENKTIHYLIAYILVQHNTNHAQPIVNDLKLILLAYGIFLFRVIDYMGIDTFGVETMVMYPREHLVGDNMIHRIGIFKSGALWKYREDHNTLVDFNMSHDV